VTVGGGTGNLKAAAACGRAAGPPGPSESGRWHRHGQPRCRGSGCQRQSLRPPGQWRRQHGLRLPDRAAAESVTVTAPPRRRGRGGGNKSVAVIRVGHWPPAGPGRREEFSESESESLPGSDVQVQVGPPASRRRRRRARLAPAAVRSHWHRQWQVPSLPGTGSRLPVSPGRRPRARRPLAGPTRRRRPAGPG
jgi:hypothetical protein